MPQPNPIPLKEMTTEELIIEFRHAAANAENRLPYSFITEKFLALFTTVAARLAALAAERDKLAADLAQRDEWIGGVESAYSKQIDLLKENERLTAELATVRGELDQSKACTKAWQRDRDDCLVALDDIRQRVGPHTPAGMLALSCTFENADAIAAARARLHGDAERGDEHA
jgi:hypothetical protein